MTKDPLKVDFSESTAYHWSKKIRTYMDSDVDIISRDRFYEAMVNRLYMLMDLREVNAATLVRLSGVSKSSMIRLMKRQKEPQLMTVVKLCIALGCDIDALIYDRAFNMADPSMANTEFCIFLENDPWNVLKREMGDERRASPATSVTLDTYRLDTCLRLARAVSDSQMDQFGVHAFTKIGRTNLNRYMQNERLPKPHQLANLCYALGECTADLVKTDKYVITKERYYGFARS